MFKVKNKTTEQIYTVYNVQQGLDFAYFLIYNETGWHWETSSFYEPYNERS